MKRFILLILAVVAIGCNSIGIDNSKPIVKVDASLNGFTKATDTAFEDGDEIGVFIDNLIQNGKFVYNTGSFKSDKEYEWYDDKELVANVYSYYPYNQSVSLNDFSFGVQSNQESERAYKASDLLIAASTAKPTDESIKLNFKHLLSKIDISLINNSELEIASIGFKDVATNGLVEFESQSITSEVVLNDVIAHKVADNIWSLILIPQVAKPQLIVRTSDNEEISYILDSEITLLSGKRYNAEITLESPSIATISFKSSIKDWTADNNIDFKQNPFEITLISADPDDYEIRIVPKDKYIMYYAVELFVDNSDLREVSNNDIVYSIVSNWEDNAKRINRSYENYARLCAKKGELTVDKNYFGKLPAKFNLALIVFGFEEDFRTPSTNIVRFYFTTDEQKPAEKINMSFDFVIEDLVVTVSATPEDQAFYFNILETEIIKYYEKYDAIEQLAQDLWSYTIDQYLENYSISKIIDAFCSQGTDSFDFSKSVSPDTEYAVIAFGVGNDGMVNSNVGISEPFRTPLSANAQAIPKSSSTEFKKGFNLITDSKLPLIPRIL